MRKVEWLVTEAETEQKGEKKKQSSGFCPSSHMFPLQRKNMASQGVLFE